MKITYTISGLTIPGVGKAEEGKTVSVSKEMGKDLINQGIAIKHEGRSPKKEEVVKTMVEKQEAKGGKE